jgi:hypothetical protein
MAPKKATAAKRVAALGFISYSHKDVRRCDELREHLSQLVRERIIEVWHDGRIDQRIPWERDIRDKLKMADVVLLLISARFLSSYYCCEVEVREAMNRHARGKTIVLPVLIGRCDYEKAEFATLNVFQLNGGPISGTRDRRDAGWTALAKKVRSLLDSS